MHWAVVRSLLIQSGRRAYTARIVVLWASLRAAVTAQSERRALAEQGGGYYFAPTCRFLGTLAVSRTLGMTHYGLWLR